MDYSYILNTSVPQKDKLLAFGFAEAGGNLMLKKEIADGQFYAEIKLSDKTLTADVFETATNEKYVLFNVASAQGAFVGQIRSEVQDVIEKSVRSVLSTRTSKKSMLIFCIHILKPLETILGQSSRTIQVPFIAARTTNGSPSSCKSNLRISVLKVMSQSGP